MTWDSSAATCTASLLLPKKGNSPGTHMNGLPSSWTIFPKALTNGQSFITWYDAFPNDDPSKWNARVANKCSVSCFEFGWIYCRWVLIHHASRTLVLRKLFQNTNLFLHHCLQSAQFVGPGRGTNVLTKYDDSIEWLVHMRNDVFDITTLLNRSSWMLTKTTQRKVSPRMQWVTWTSTMPISSNSQSLYSCWTQRLRKFLLVLQRMPLRPALPLLPTLS